MAQLEQRGLTADEVSDVYQRYGALLARRCRLLLRDSAQADDAVQELVSVLLRRGEGLRAAESPYRWLCRVADRTCLDLLRRGRRLRTAVDIDALDPRDPVGTAPGIDPEARLAVVESLALLDEAQQSLAIMLFVDGLTQGEAATELGVSRVTVNKRTQEIRAKLRISHESTGLEEEALTS
ncbi:MAG: polymerase, sigma-24 subunit, subfamily [Labilithrix sp.]|nr:polymerase, sigma-24 subunit, subfamily [Labilithrix sp.]